MACTFGTSNDSSVEFADGKYTKIGEATETALIVLVEKMNALGTDVAGLSDADRVLACNTAMREPYDKNFTLEFSRDRKSMSVYVSEKGSRRQGQLLVKGAPEEVLCCAWGRCRGGLSAHRRESHQASSLPCSESSNAISVKSPPLI